MTRNLWELQCPQKSFFFVSQAMCCSFCSPLNKRQKTYTLATQKSSSVKIEHHLFLTWLQLAQKPVVSK